MSLMHLQRDDAAHLVGGREHTHLNMYIRILLQEESYIAGLFCRKKSYVSGIFHRKACSIVKLFWREQNHSQINKEITPRI